MVTRASTMSRHRDLVLEQTLTEDHVWLPYTQAKTARSPWRVVSAEGVYLTLADGRQIIDGIASWWTACHGHRHPHILEAVTDQLERLPHVMLGGLVHEPVEALARQLVAIAPGALNHVFFCDSGSVAVEVAMKMAVQFWINQGVRGRTRFITFLDAYHGDTTGAMSLCDPDEGMHAHFKGFLLEQFPSALPQTASEFAALRRFVAQHQSTAAALIIEPLIQAAGGMRFHSPEQLREVHEIATAHDLLVIHDEIATGFGRTGKMFASQWAEIGPDIMCIGKALTGGIMSLAAAMATSEVYAAFYRDEAEAALMHGPTYMGNPLACRAASASLELFAREPRLEQVARIEEIGRSLLPSARRLDGVLDVRCQGAFLVVELDHWVNSQAVMTQAPDLGVWLRPLRNTLYLAPPLTIRDEELVTLVQAALELIRRGV